MKKSVTIFIIFSSLIVCGVSMHSKSAEASGIPVIDAANLQQNTVDAIEAVAQTIKQIEEYALQLQQYEDQLKNTGAPWAYVWSKAQTTMESVVSLQAKVNSYINSASDLNAYLLKYGSVSTYRSSEYFGRQDGGTDEQAAQLMEAEEVGSEIQKDANDAAVRTLVQQEASIQTDAETLEKLQLNAETAQGRMEALQYANQLMAQQNSQLLQLRAQLVAQQKAEIVRAQTVSAREAKQMAVREALLESRYVKSEAIEWTVD